MTPSELITRWRAAKDISARELSRRASVSEAQIRRIEKGQAPKLSPVFVRLLDALEVDDASRLSLLK